MSHFLFEPAIQLYALNKQQLVILFDSQCEIDQHRSPKLITFLNTFAQLSLTLEGFEQFIHEDNQLLLEGNVYLIVTDQQQFAHQHLLATYQLKLPINQTRKNGIITDDNYQAEKIKKQLQHKIATAFTQTITRHFENQCLCTTQNHHVINAITPNLLAPGKTTTNVQLENKTEKKRNTREYLFIFIVVTLFSLLLCYLYYPVQTAIKTNPPEIETKKTSISSTNQDDIKQLLTQPNTYSFSNNDEMKQTLLSMGLDPGENDMVFDPEFNQSCSQQP